MKLWVFINGQLDYTDKNIYMDPIVKSRTAGVLRMQVLPAR